MSRPIHIGAPPSRCGRASSFSAWHPTDGTCQHCTGEASTAGRAFTQHEPEDPGAAAILATRLRLGMTQEVMAAALGISRPTLVAWERRTTRLVRERAWMRMSLALERGP